MKKITPEQAMADAELLPIVLEAYEECRLELEYFRCADLVGKDCATSSAEGE